MDRILLSSKRIYQYAAAVIAVILLLCFAECAVYARRELYRECLLTMEAAKEQIEYRVQQSIDLLSALAEREEYADPNLPVLDKVLSLEGISDHMGYMMIRYVDSEINVQSRRGSTTLASRDYMQRLFATGEVQVTDSFAAGADGVTLNYTVAVPLYHESKIAGCLFCAIYFDDIQQLLTGAARGKAVEVTLLGSKNQMMSATDTMHYGESYLDYIRGATILGNTQHQIEEDLLRYHDGSGSFWMADGLDIDYSTYSYIENTSWSILSTMDYWSTFGANMLEGLVTLLVCIAIIVATAAFSGHFLVAQREQMQELAVSVGNLERKLSLDEKHDGRDFSKALKLTNEGLSDGLTGVVTRSVFTNQIQRRLGRLPQGELAVLCFVDLDDLKKLNDQHGHSMGDHALKEVGFVLREYEKLFDGLVGRYGGDEFILMLAGFRDRADLEQVMAELSGRLRIPIPGLEPDGFAHCSVGVAVWDGEMDYDMLLRQADHALYHAKQSGKGSYEIYEGEDAL